MNGYIHYTNIATDIPVAILEILENVDYSRTPQEDIANAETVILQMMEAMTKKTKNYDVLPRSTNISAKVLKALDLVDWKAYSEAELLNMCGGLDSNIRTFLTVLQ